MNRLFICCLGIFLVAGCDIENTKSSLQSPLTEARSEYISTCIEMTPGGQSYQEACACGFDRGMQLMSKKEQIAYFRGFTEIEDLQYVLSAPAKLIEAQAGCAAEALDFDADSFTFNNILN